MKIPRYWVRGAASMAVRNPATGKETTFACWGWSDASLAEAAEHGRSRAEAVAARVQQGQRPDRYMSYGGQPLREETIEEWKKPDNTVYAAVTRNAYGCQVLNTAAIMFVDVDFPASSAAESLKSGFRRLFGGRGPSPRERQEAEALAKVQGMIQAEPHCGIRVYRTCAGLRYLLTHSPASPTAATTLRAMQALGGDPLYIALCKAQECFRARLTPKPWRCGMPALAVRYPWPNRQVEEQVRGWGERYARKAAGYATCALVQHFGQTGMDAETTRVVEFHDRLTGVGHDLPLA